MKSSKRTKQKILFIGDPLFSLKLDSDTSLAFCEAAIKLNFEVLWCEKKDVSFVNYEIIITNPSLILNVSIDSIQYKEFISKNQQHNTISFSEFTSCFIRTDPPFDNEYKDLCWILNTQTKVKIYNSPSVLLNFHEKSLPWLAFAEGILKKENLIPTCFSESSEIIKTFINTQKKSGVQKFITKPWLGYAGNDVVLWNRTDNRFYKYISSSKHKLMIQPFLDDIYTEGDRRVLFINGKVIFSFVRLPQKNKVASNLAQGGTGILKEMTHKQKKLCKNIGRFLIKHSISIAGVDLIGTKVGEINITSPTGFRTYEKLSHTNITQKAFTLIVTTP